MAVPFDRHRMLTLSVLGALVVVETIATAVLFSSDLDDKALTVLIRVSPLLVVALAVRLGGTRTLAFTCAWITIAGGVWTHFFLLIYTAYAATQGFFAFAVTTVAYWICGFLALFSFPRWSDA